MTGREEGYAPGRARREAILEQAVAVFGTSGFDHATLTDIATACGVSRQGLLHHFASKEDLLTAVLDRRDRLDRERFSAVIAANRTPAEALVDIMADNTRNPDVMRLYTVLSAEATNVEHAAHDYFVELYRRLRTELADAVTAAQRAGTLPAAWPADTLATMMLALKDGLALQALLSPELVDPVQTIRQINAILLAASPPDSR